MKTGSLVLAFWVWVMGQPPSLEAAQPATRGIASWYGEEHRGRPMANRQPFDPDRLTCASWFYPLGTWLVVERTDGLPGRVVVQVTDRGPHRRLVRAGRIVDLSRAAFARIEGLEMGLCEVRVQPATWAGVRSGTADKTNSPDATTAESVEPAGSRSRQGVAGRDLRIAHASQSGGPLHRLEGGPMLP